MKQILAPTYLLAAAVLAMTTPVMAQNPVSYQVGLIVEGDVLRFDQESNCPGTRPNGEVCISGESGAEIVFTLRGRDEGWVFSRFEIRDPAANWGDALPGPAARDFGKFNEHGQMDVPPGVGRSLVVQDANSQAIAVQYRIVARNIGTGQQSKPAHGVMDNDGGASGRGD